MFYPEIATCHMQGKSLLSYLSGPRAIFLSQKQLERPVLMARCPAISDILTEGEGRELVMKQRSAEQIDRVG